MNDKCKVHFLCRCLVGHHTEPLELAFCKMGSYNGYWCAHLRPATPYPPGRDPRNDMCLRIPNGCHLGQGLGHFSSKLTLNLPIMLVPRQLAVPGQILDTYLPISRPRQNFRHIQSFLGIPSCDPIIYRYPEKPFDTVPWHISQTDTSRPIKAVQPTSKTDTSRYIDADMHRYLGRSRYSIISTRLNAPSVMYTYSVKECYANLCSLAQRKRVGLITQRS